MRTEKRYLSLPPTRQDLTQGQKPEGQAYGEARFNQNVFSNWLNMGLLQRVWREEIFHVVGTDWVSGKENVLRAAVSKESHANNILGHERAHHYWFPLKKKWGGRL